MEYDDIIRTKRKMTPTKVIVLGFLVLILLGGLLLSLPVCNNGPIQIWDAMFTSASAVCVTGLGTMTTATQFTLFGQLIILLLIQIRWSWFYGFCGFYFDGYGKKNYFV